MSTEKYKNRYRIPSARADWHAYDGGTYFITICTAHMLHYFGEIKGGKMVYTEIGNYLDEQIKTTPALRKDMNVEIPLYVIMPNHIHLIIIIDNDNNNIRTDAIKRRKHCVSTVKNTQCSTDAVPASQNTKFAPQRKNLASIIRGIKSATTSFARKNDIEFAWQSRFHDRIVRNQNECNRIANYIENNIAKWEYDKYYNEKYV